MAVLNSSIVVGDLTVLGKITSSGSDPFAQPVYADASAASGVSSGYKQLKIITAAELPASGVADANTIYIIVE